MAIQYSVLPDGRKIRAGFKGIVEKAESVEEVREFFERMAEAVLFVSIGDKVEVREDDVLFDPNDKDGYRLSYRLERNPMLSRLIEASDLKNILADIADRAIYRYNQLEADRKTSGQKAASYPRSWAGRMPSIIDEAEMQDFSLKSNG